MTFGTFFRLSSYAMVACGTLALFASGGIGAWLAAAFAGLLVLAWRLEGTKWQLTERMGLLVVLLSLPLFYVDWKYQMGSSDPPGRVGIGALAHLIIFLSAVKLLQVKADRDWVFVYLISFFEALLAAGLSTSGVFLASFGLYTLCALSTIIAFEMKKAGRAVKIEETRLIVPPGSSLTRRLARRKARGSRAGRTNRRHEIARRLPLIATVLLVLIVALALPLFFVLPRYGANAFANGNGGLTGFVGFSSEVTLGAIGRLQQSDKVVMRVRVEGAHAPGQSLRWRGIALDQFNGRGWRRSRGDGPVVQPTGDGGLYQVGTTEGLHRLTIQTFFIEPIDTPYLFAAPRVVALQGVFPFILRDREGSISTVAHDLERVTYKVYSDTEEPDEDVLRLDDTPYSAPYGRYLQIPDDVDPRIAELAARVVERSRAGNRYDEARAIESYLQTEFGYTLDLKPGGADPLSDFLFRVREGHCEYFATAMAIMLRTRGVATRVVNGFQVGEYNPAADAYTVTQREAHSWVEVYFPQTGSWVTFDPTPVVGRTVRSETGIGSTIGKYAEALELFWIQYIVSYDKQEQRSLATSLRGKVREVRRSFSMTIDSARAAIVKWMSARFGANGSRAESGLRLLPLVLVALGGLVFVATLTRRVYRLGFWLGLQFWQREGKTISSVQFYERMIRALAARGYERGPDQTPLEFAIGTGTPEALKITRLYNGVRFGLQPLSTAESAKIEAWLRRIEGKDEG